MNELTKEQIAGIEKHRIEQKKITDKVQSDWDKKQNQKNENHKRRVRGN